MKKVIYILLFILLAHGISSAQTVGNISSESVKIEAQPAKGFAYPNNLYVPKVMREEYKDSKKRQLKTSEIGRFFSSLETVI